MIIERNKLACVWQLSFAHLHFYLLSSYKSALISPISVISGQKSGLEGVLRVLLVTPGAIDFPLGSGEVLRKIVGAMPPDTVYWASLKQGKVNTTDNVVDSKVFPLGNEFTWRIRNSVLGSIVWKEINAVRRARAIARWAQEFKPDVIWILAEEDAVNVGLRLYRLTGIPVHLTFHDAPEILTDMFGHYHPLVARLYKRRLRQLVECADSMDAVCQELIDHVLVSTGAKRPEHEMVFPPSLSVGMAGMRGDLRQNDYGPRVENVVLQNNERGEGEVKRIGFCGSLRTSDEQWLSFLKTLSVLPFAFEIVAFMDKDYFPDIEMPENVRFKHFDFVVTDDFLERFVEEGCDACYLGLYKEKEWDLFCRTSLSSKLATYAAAGLPIMVDAPSDSVVWRYVDKYSAGILCEDEKNTVEGLKFLFSDNEVWTGMANGSRRMFESEFELDRNVEEFCKCLASRQEE